MTEAVEKIKADLARLSPEEQAEVADFLITSLENGGTDEELDPALVEELNRRWEEIVSGKAVGIPYEEVMAELREKYP